MNEEEKDLEYWKKNAEEDYMRVPISVLRYITELEKAVGIESKIEYISNVSDLSTGDVVYHITDDEKGVVLGGIKDGMIEVEWSSNTRSYCDITILYYKV